MPAPIALPAALAAFSALKWWMGNRANDRAADRQYAALDNAQGAIQGAADKAMSYQQPYLQNAGADFNQFRNMVQSGFFQQPYGQSFQSQSFQGPSFAFNPSAGNASFASWQPQGGPASFQSRALPGFPSQPPAQQQAPAAGPMVRTNQVPVPLEDMMRAGMQSVTPQNRPGMVQVGAPMNPMEEIIQRGQAPAQNGGSPYTPPGPMTMKQLVDARMVNRYGSGTFIPQTYGRR